MLQYLLAHDESVSVSIDQAHKVWQQEMVNIIFIW